MYTFTYQKTLHHTLLLPVFKVVESLQCTLKKQSSKNISGIAFELFHDG